MNTPQPVRRRTTRPALVAIACGLASSAAAGPILTTYLEAHGQDWREWRNWDTGIVPNNTVDDSFFVDIPQFRSVVIDWFGTTQVSALTLDRETSLTVNDGLFRPGVVSFGENSTIRAAGGDIEFDNPEGDWSRARVTVAAGSSVSSVLERVDDCVVMTLSAEATSASVDFSALTVVRGGPDALFNASAVGGTVDLTGLTTLDVPSGWLATNGGSIIAGAFGGSTIRSISIEPTSLVSLPGVVSLAGATIRLSGDAHLQTGVLESIDNANIVVDDGAQVSFPVAQITNTGPHGTILRAEHATLELPNLTRIETTADAGNLLIAGVEGTLAFGQLTEIVGDGTVHIEIGSSQLDIPRLERIEPTLFLSLRDTHAFGDIEFGPIATLTLGDADVSFAGAVDLTGTDIRLSGDTQLSFGTLVSLDNARIEVTGQTLFAPQVATISLDDPAVFVTNWTVREEGLLNLYSVDEINIGPGMPPESRIAVEVRDLGQVVLGQAHISVQPGAYISFAVHGPDAGILLSQVESIDGPSSWSVDGGGTLSTPPTLMFDKARSISLGGGTMLLPGLQSLDETAIGISAETLFEMGAPVTALHNTSVNASYDWTIPGASLSWTRPGAWTVLRSRNCVLSAPDLETIEFVPEPVAEPVALVIEADQNSLVDLSSVTTIQGPDAGSGHALLLQTRNGGGVLDLSALESAAGVIKLEAYGYNSVLYWGTDINMDTSPDDLTGNSLSVRTGGRLVCGGSITATLVGDAVPGFSTGTFQFVSPDSQAFEAFAIDHGLAYSPQGRRVQNLIVGSEDVPTRLAMVDAIDNGNRGPNGEPEAIYIHDSNLPGLGSVLSISHGSSLVLNGVPVYVEAQDEQVLLNDLFPADQRAFAFGQGTVYRVDPDLCPADFTTPFGVLDFFDAQAFLNLLSAGDAEADLTGDDSLDFFDLQAFLNSFAGGCP